MDFSTIIDSSSLGVHFFKEEVEFELAEDLLSDWLKAVIQEEEKILQSVRFIFCNDAYLHQINIDYLDHDTLTDVITFPYATSEAVIEGEIYISIERVKENAEVYGVSFQEELHRIIVHGVLHLCGYDDKGQESKKDMSEKEDFYLKKLSLRDSEK